MALQSLYINIIILSYGLQSYSWYMSVKPGTIDAKEQVIALNAILGLKSCVSLLNMSLSIGGHHTPQRSCHLLPEKKISATSDKYLTSLTWITFWATHWLPRVNVQHMGRLARCHEPKCTACQRGQMLKAVKDSNQWQSQGNVTACDSQGNEDPMYHVSWIHEGIPNRNHLQWSVLPQEAQSLHLRHLIDKMIEWVKNKSK